MEVGARVVNTVVAMAVVVVFVVLSSPPRASTVVTALTSAIVLTLVSADLGITGRNMEVGARVVNTVVAMVVVAGIFGGSLFSPPRASTVVTALTSAIVITFVSGDPSITGRNRQNRSVLAEIVVVAVVSLEVLGEVVVTAVVRLSDVVAAVRFLLLLLLLCCLW